MQEPAWDIRGDLEWGTIPRMLEDSVARFGPQPAIVDEDVTLTYAALGEAVTEAAAGLMAHSVRAGDRVAIWLPNCWEWIVAALAAQSVGAALVPVNTRFKGPEAAFVLDRSDAVALFTTTEFLGTDYVAMLRDVTASHPLRALHTIVVAKGPVPDDAVGWDSMLAAGSSLTSRDVSERAAQVHPDDLADILFTSGTTGRPKGAMCTHAQGLRAYRDWSEIVTLQAGDRYLIVNPFFHGFGYKSGWLASLMMGATIYPHPVFEVEPVLERVQRERITVFPGTPTLFQSLMQHPDFEDYDISSLRLCVTGATTIPVEFLRELRDRFTFDHMTTGYGLTEASAIATMCRPDDDLERVVNSAGRPIPGTEVVVVDGNGNELVDQPGEVLVRGYHVMKGYYNEPEDTATTITEDGWLRTGDVGVIDSQGYLTITDRIKDMLIVGGFNAYPAEIENVLLEHPDVSQVAVVGGPDERLGEAAYAYIVPARGVTGDVEEIVAWSRANIANYKVPRRVFFVDELPVSAAGKVLKRVLRDRAQQDADTPPSTT